MQALFLYAPVVHKELLDYIENNSDQTVVLLDNIKAQSVNKFLERDIRALPAEKIKTALEAYGHTDVQIVNQENASDVLSAFSAVHIPQDEIIQQFVASFASSITTETVSLFSRWTKQISTVEHEVPAHRTISEDVFAQEQLDTLETEAQRSPDWWRQIAAAIVKDGQVLGVAHNKHYPSAHALTINGDPRSNFDAGEGQGIYTSIHAEAFAIAQAARQGTSTEGADMYVTTFPCPTCARSLVETGIKRVFYRHGYSALDAEQILSDTGIEIILVK